MKQLIVKKGRVLVENVPAPKIGPDTVLVQVKYSSISIGTEIAGVSSSKDTLLKKALKEPQKIKTALDRIQKIGAVNTIRQMREKFNIGKQIGYSASGVVQAVGKNIHDIKINDKVACAGAGIANHSEFIEVPRNLLVKIPKNVDLKTASTITLGTIALQGVRRADAKLGEFIAVFGLGIIGQITVQLLKACGCKVIGIDINQRRIEKAVELGIDYAINPLKQELLKIIDEWTAGYGVDSVIIAADTDKSEVLSNAFKMCRKKGKVILVGVVGMEINREDIYEKELDFYISTSYGPGRYDNLYERKNIDYPYGYVRWTENRNMQEYLYLISKNLISIDPLIEKEYSLIDAPNGYEEIMNIEPKPLICVLKYNDKSTPSDDNKIINNNIKLNIKESVSNVAIIGAGSYALSKLIPEVIRLNNYYRIYAIANKTGSKAKHIAETYNAQYSTTDYKDVLKDPKINSVIISTRHNLHTKIATEALISGKGVFLEKPAALNMEELSYLYGIIQKQNLPFMVGFNRRFSKCSKAIKTVLDNRINPMMVVYQMNAGFIPYNNWVHTEEGGGRLVGEACHIFDLFNYFTNANAISVSVDKLNFTNKDNSKDDNAVITVKYDDGSVCTLLYTSLGHGSRPKEKCDIYFDGNIITLDDFREVKGYGVNLDISLGNRQDKGQYAQLKEFGKYLQGKRKEPIPILQLVQATKISILAQEAKIG